MTNLKRVLVFSWSVGGAGVRKQWIAVAAPSAAPHPAIVAAPPGLGVTAPSAEDAADAGILLVEHPAPAAEARAAYTRQPARRAPRAHRAGLVPHRRAVAPHEAAAVGQRAPTPPPSRSPGGSGRPYRRPPWPLLPTRWTMVLGGAACTWRRRCRGVRERRRPRGHKRRFEAPRVGGLRRRGGEPRAWDRSVDGGGGLRATGTPAEGVGAHVSDSFLWRRVSRLGVR